MTSNRDKSPSTRLRYFVAGPPERQAVFSHTGCSRWPPLFSRPPGSLAVKPIQQVVLDAIVPSTQSETLKQHGVYQEDTLPARSPPRIIQDCVAIRTGAHVGVSMSLHNSGAGGGGQTNKATTRSGDPPQNRRTRRSSRG